MRSWSSKLADRTTVYTHRDPDKVMSAWAGKRIHEQEHLTVQSFDPGFVDDVVAVLERLLIGLAEWRPSGLSR